MAQVLLCHIFTVLGSPSLTQAVFALPNHQVAAYAWPTDCYTCLQVACAQCECVSVCMMLYFIWDKICQRSGNMSCHLWGLRLLNLSVFYIEVLTGDCLLLTTHSFALYTVWCTSVTKVATPFASELCLSLHHFYFFIFFLFCWSARLLPYTLMFTFNFLYFLFYYSSCAAVLLPMAPFMSSW